MIKVSVKDLARIMASGDLSIDFQNNRSNKDAIDAHRYIQNRYNEDSKKEAHIKLNYTYQGYEFDINGIMDGLLMIKGEPIIEEIKSTTKELIDITEDYHLEHLAQLKIYCYMYMVLKELDSVKAYLTYIRIQDYSQKKFRFKFTLFELELFMQEVLDKYLEFYLLVKDLNENKLKTLKEITFPFDEFRKGQEDLINATIFSIKKKDILYASAPTGIGKTVSTLYSALKCIEDPLQKIFYLTSRNLSKDVALSTMQTFINKGLKLKTINITAKRKICPFKDGVCDTDKCPLCKDYYLKLNDAIKECLNTYDIIDYKEISALADEYKICPYEFTLDLSYYADVVICDYNYVFDPTAHLIRYFEEDTYKSIVLIDEAHNLVDRTRNMYSASLNTTNLKELKKACKDIKPSINGRVKKVIDALDLYDLDATPYTSLVLDPNVISALDSLKKRLEEILNMDDLENKKDILENYLVIKKFIDLLPYFSNSHRFIVKKDFDKEYNLEIRCLSSTKIVLSILKSCIESTVLFSATLNPLEYYKREISNNLGYEIVLDSPYDPNNLKVIINDEISTKYNDRKNSVKPIQNILKTLTNKKKGNFIVFFPSYEYLNLVLDGLDVNARVIVHERNATEFERLEVLREFDDTTEAKILLTVLGGSFNEGIDLVGEKLSGVVVIGTGLPKICYENDLLKDYYEEQELDGFLNAYIFPGINKVIQAAGRVIRSENDKGVVILIDSRYTRFPYRSLLPSNLSHKMICNDIDHLEETLDNFFKD